MTTRLLDIAETAQRLGRPVTTLYDWRYKKVGPPSAKLGGRIVYREVDVKAFIEAAFAADVG